MASLNLRTLTIALIGLSCTHLTIAEGIANHEDLVRESINKKSAQQLQKQASVKSDSTVIGYDASYVTDAGLEIDVQAGQIVVISPKDPKKPLSVVGLRDVEHGVSQHPISGINVTNRGTLTIEPKITVESKTPGLISQGIVINGDDTKGTSTFENNVAVTLDGVSDDIETTGLVVKNQTVTISNGISVIAKTGMRLANATVKLDGPVRIKSPVLVGYVENNGSQDNRTTLNINQNGKSELHLNNQDKPMSFFAENFVGEVNIKVDNPRSDVNLAMEPFQGTLSGKLIVSGPGTKVKLFQGEAAADSRNRPNWLENFSLRVENQGRITFNNPEPNKKRLLISKISLDHGEIALDKVYPNLSATFTKIEGEGKLILPLDVNGVSLEEDPSGPDPHGPHPHGSHPHGPDPRGPNQHGPDPRGPNQHGPDPRGPHPHGPGNTPSDSLANTTMTLLDHLDGKLEIALEVKNFDKSKVEGKRFLLFGLMSEGQYLAVTDPVITELEKKGVERNSPEAQQAKKQQLENEFAKYKESVRAAKADGTLYRYGFDISGEEIPEELKLPPQNMLNPALQSYYFVFYANNLRAEDPVTQPTDLVDSLIGIETSNLLVLQSFNDTLYDRLGDLRFQPADRASGLWVRSTHSQARKDGVFGFKSRQDRVDFGWDKRLNLSSGNKAWMGLTLQWHNLDFRNPYTHLNNHLMNVGAYASVMNDAGWYADGWHVLGNI